MTSDNPVRVPLLPRLTRSLASQLAPGDLRFLWLLVPQTAVSAFAMVVFAVAFDLPPRYVQLHLITIALVQAAFYLVCGRVFGGGRDPARRTAGWGYATAWFIKGLALNALYLASFASNHAWASNLSFANLRYAAPHIRGFAEVFGGWIYVAAIAVLAAIATAYWLALRSRGALLGGLQAAFPRRGWRRFPVLATLLIGALAAEWWYCHWLRVDIRSDPILAFYLNPSPVTPAEAADITARRNYPAVVPTFQPRHVIVVTIDSLRSDHLGTLGYERDTTPFLSTLQRAGRLASVPFSVSVANDSAGGIFAVLGSVYVERHHPGNFTLCEVLRKLGYHTYLIGAGDHTTFDNMRPLYGTSFQLFSDGLTRKSHSVNDDRGLLDALARIPDAGDRPAFFFFHLMSAHSLAVRLPGHDLWSAGIPESDGPARARARYDAGVRQADDVLRQIFELLEAKGYLRDYVAAVTGDHGEGLGEHGHIGHIQRLFMEDIRVPILLVDSRGAPAIVARFGCQLDIAPTLLEQLGLPVPSSWQGQPLSRPDQPRTVFLRSKGGRSWRGMVRHESGADLKYLFLKHGAEAGREQLFNLTADPAEQQDLIGTANPELIRQLRTAATAYFAEPLP